MYKLVHQKERRELRRIYESGSARRRLCAAAREQRRVRTVLNHPTNQDPRHVMKAAPSSKKRKRPQTTGPVKPIAQVAEQSVAQLSALLPDAAADYIRQLLERANGDVTLASNFHFSDLAAAAAPSASSVQKQIAAPSLSARSGSLLPDLARAPANRKTKSVTKQLRKPEDVNRLTPCELFLNALPSEFADNLLKNTLEESKKWRTYTMQMFDNVVESPRVTNSYSANVDYEVRINWSSNQNASSLTSLLSTNHCSIKVTRASITELARSRCSWTKRGSAWRRS